MRKKTKIDKFWRFFKSDLRCVQTVPRSLRKNGVFPQTQKMYLTESFTLQLSTKMYYHSDYFLQEKEFYCIVVILRGL